MQQRFYIPNAAQAECRNCGSGCQEHGTELVCVCVPHSDGSVDVCTPQPGENFFMGEETNSSLLSCSNKKPWATVVLQIKAV